MAIGSCEPEAAHSAALPVREPHSVPQTAAARRSPRGSPEALQPLPPYLPPEGVLPRSTRRGRPLRPPGALAISSCELQAAPNATPCAESLTARRSAQSAARGARGVTAAPAIITLSRRHAALSEAGTVLRPSDALATCSCELQAVPDAATRAGEPHSAPQHSAARRLPREPLAASHRPPRASPSRGVLSRTARQGRS